MLAILLAILIKTCSECYVAIKSCRDASALLYGMHMVSLQVASVACAHALLAADVAHTIATASLQIKSTPLTCIAP